MADDGWDLALSFWRPYDDRLELERQPDDPERLASDLRKLGRTVELIPADLEDAASAADLPVVVGDEATRGALDMV